jgi:stearoyl-CoA desaturase (delta-9 desaturase)
MPTLIAATWGDAMGGYVWGGLVARVIGKLFLLDDCTA